MLIYAGVKDFRIFGAEIIIFGIDVNTGSFFFNRGGGSHYVEYIICYKGKLVIGWQPELFAGFLAPYYALANNGLPRRGQETITPELGHDDPDLIVIRRDGKEIAGTGNQLDID